MDNFLLTMQQFYQQHTQDWSSDIVAIIVFSLVVWIVWRIIYARLSHIADKTKLAWDDVILLSLKSPVSTLIWCWPMTIGTGILLEDVFNRSVSWTQTAQILLVISIIIWTLYRLIGNSEDILERNSKYDTSTVQALAKIARLMIFALGILTMMQTLGLSLSGLLTFGGVGGLVVGFAAKDLLSNFFGGIVVYLDRPFRVGDWIRSTDRNIEGTVERIGWRMTIIRTFDKRPLYVPNSIFTNIVVENPSRMQNRRINETIGIRYQDADKMDGIIRDVTEMIRNHPDIDNKQTIIVNFTSFGPSSLDFFIYTFTKTVEWVHFHEVKQNVLLKVLDIIHQHDADVAFPTRTLHMQSSQVEPEITPADDQNNTETTK
ncbi:mechanosensitive ion channel family protein [Vibrio sp. S11_S32]|uniref:mechanosensitive ion channel family protein n=1 Tax=Vibrio sp. S11_S32 TaxID=2720225 RepID=UPI00168183E2|nr:mechanosensitive ion channel family protein [Vibrio sp. S11_S32]MBD1577725.1 mechanosensitive ion channel family protein [Vibrio sp. S11_S32]